VVRLKGAGPVRLRPRRGRGVALRGGHSRRRRAGIGSALAAPALAGIPVTHRGVSTGVVIVSGHAEAGYAPVIDSPRRGRQRSSC
jgi:hypothetical protein